MTSFTWTTAQDRVQVSSSPSLLTLNYFTTYNESLRAFRSYRLSIISPLSGSIGNTSSRNAMRPPRAQIRTPYFLLKGSIFLTRTTCCFPNDTLRPNGDFHDRFVLYLDYDLP